MGLEPDIVIVHDPMSREDTMNSNRISVTVHSVSSNTLRDAQIWSILPHIALAASGFSCFRHENASRYSGLCTVTDIRYRNTNVCFFTCKRFFLLV